METEQEETLAKELERLFEAQAPAIIGEGRRRETELVDWVDPDEARYNHKLGLGKNGEPMPVDEVLEKRLEESGYHMTMGEGYDLLEMAGDDDGSGLFESNDSFNNSGFNQW